MLDHPPGTPAIIIGRTEGQWATDTVERVTATLIHTEKGYKVVRKTGRTRSPQDDAPRLVFKDDPGWAEAADQWEAIKARRTVRFWARKLVESPDDILVIAGAIRRLTDVREWMEARQ